MIEVVNKLETENNASIFTDTDLELLTEISEHVAIAITNSSTMSMKTSEIKESINKLKTRAQ